MELKDFQSAVLERLDEYLNVLKTEYAEENVLVTHYQKKGQKRNFTLFCKQAWEKLQEKQKLPVLRNKQGKIQKTAYISATDGLGNSIPHICLKVPTGGGKTLMGVHAVEAVHFNYFTKNTGLVLWVVPTEAIYRQTLKSFKSKTHPYRQVLERASGGRVKILEKTSAFSPRDIRESLCVMLLMLQSANRDTKESLRVFKDSGKFIEFFPNQSNYLSNHQLLSKIKNLDFHGDRTQTLGGIPNVSIKHSLGNALRIVQPLTVLDEGHRAYSDLARETISKLNPRFILELSATPNMNAHRSNVLVQVSGVRLKAEEMIKIPINILNSQKGDWKKTLSQAYEKRQELYKQCQQFLKQSHRYIRPIMLIQVERTGREQRGGKFIHSEDARDYLIHQLGVHPQSIRLKTSGQNELKDENLLSNTSPVEYIITNKALQEGWDCPFAYVLALLGKSQSRQALTQLMGRVLRQPYAQKIKDFPELNESYVVCHNRVVGEVVEDIRKGLQKEGMHDVIDHVKYEGHPLKKKTVKRRKGKEFEKTIFVPRVLYREKGHWRKIIYESDILKNINYSQISYSKKDSFTVKKLKSLQTDVIKLDMEDRHGQLSLPTVKRHSHIQHNFDLDFVLMTERLSHFIPNPLQAGRILDETLSSLKTKGVSHQAIYLHRNALLNDMETDLRDQLEDLSEQLFIKYLKTGKICFKIFKNQIDINWAMPSEIDFLLTPQDKILRKRDDSDFQLTLFEKTYQSHYNHFEKKVAWYLDEDKTIKWWHRMIARQGYHLQGWQKRKIWPDFLAYAVSESKGKRYVVLETKGHHLEGNTDTTYKDKLFRLLEHYHNQPVDVGRVETATEEEQKMVFKILMEKTWESDLKDTLKPS